VVPPWFTLFAQTLGNYGQPSNSMLNTSCTTCATKANQLLCLKDPQITLLAIKIFGYLQGIGAPKCFQTQK